MTDAFTKQAGRWPKVLVTFGLYPSILRRPLTGELGMRNVLFEEVAELGVKVGPPPERLFIEGAADPKMEWGAGVEG